MGENNVKTASIKLGIKEMPEMELGMGILPVIQDVRSNDQIVDQFLSSMEIRRAMSHFLEAARDSTTRSPESCTKPWPRGRTSGWPLRLSSCGQRPTLRRTTLLWRSWVCT